MKKYNKLWSLICDHLKKKNMTQAQLSKKLWVAMSVVHGIIHGRTADPKVSIIFNICRILDISIESMHAAVLSR